MKKSVGKIALTLAALTLFLLLISCKGIVPAGERPQDTAAVLKAVQTGTQGIEIVQVPNYPPDTIYDQNELVALIEVHNRGNHDISPPDCFVQITGMDPNIVGGDFTHPKSCATGLDVLEGKNVYNTEGGVNQLEFRLTNVQLPDQVYEYNPKYNIVSCYNYITNANPQVCVDPLFYQISSQQKSCTPKNVALGGGQGAPIGVSYVNVNMIGNQQAVFEINIVNQGGGVVVSPDSLLQNCGSNSITYNDLNKVRFNVEMKSGGVALNCKPRDDFVRLVNNQGKIVCTASIRSGAAYETPLSIELSYGYIKSVQKQLRIVKTPG